MLVGIGREDTPDIVDRMADKLVGLRYFRDADGRTNLSIADAEGAFLVVSQFTLYADVSRGRRPGFTDAAPPEQAVPLVDRFVVGFGRPESSWRRGGSARRWPSSS